jgi:hypothetical protein
MANDPHGSENKRVAPPYVAYPTFKNMLSGFKEHVLPARIDRTVLSNFSGIVGSQLLTALRFLDLIDGQNHPKPGLRVLVDAYGTDKWSAELTKVLQSAYGPMFDLDLTAASPGQFNERFSKTYPGEGSTLRKSTTFFLTAATDAQVPISPYITKNKKPRSAPTKKRAPRQNSDRSTDTGSQDGKRNGGAPADKTVQTDKKLSELLLSELNMEKMSEEEVSAIWTLLKYLRKEGK